MLCCTGSESIILHLSYESWSRGLAKREFVSHSGVPSLFGSVCQG